MRLFSLCQAMNWAHLPVAGGIYNQHPQLLEEWGAIFAAQARHQRSEEAKREAERGRHKTGR